MVAASSLQPSPGPAVLSATHADPTVTPRGSSDTDLTIRMALFRDTRRGADFEDLYRAARAEVLAWVVQCVGRQRVALDPFDLLQDTFVNIYRYAEGFRSDDGASFRRWARTIAGNVVRRAARTRLGSFSCASLGGLADPCDPAPGPGHGLEQRERVREVERAYGLVLLHYAAAFATLAPRDQRALVLVEVEGRSYREVAQLLGVGLSNTKMIVFRARQRLRARLERAFAAGASAAERAA